MHDAQVRGKAAREVVDEHSQGPLAYITFGESARQNEITCAHAYYPSFAFLVVIMV